MSQPHRITGYLSSDYEGAHSLAPISDDIVRESTGCPTCGVIVGVQCVYLAPYYRHGNNGPQSEDKFYHVRVARAGTSTKRLHLERVQLARIIVSKKRKTELRKKAAEDARKQFSRLPAKIQTQVELFNIKKQWDKDEQRELITWLSKYANVLWSL